jgi:hypothetical protein
VLTLALALITQVAVVGLLAGWAIRKDRRQRAGAPAMPGPVTGGARRADR